MIVVNLLLLIAPVRNYLLSFNNSSYFYINHDWQIKFDDVLRKDLSGKTAFVGTSRTLYGIDLKNRNRSSYNLGLMAASQMQINKLLEHLSKTGVKLDVLYLEINPMSLSSNHIESMSRQELEGFVDYQSWEYSYPIKSFMRDYIPMLRYSNVIKKTFRSLFSDQYAKGDKDYLQWRKSIHLEEFNTLDDATSRGGVIVNLKNTSFKNRLRGECMAMLKHSFNNSFIDLDLLEKGVDLALKAAKNVVLWSPPYSYESYSIVPQHYLQKINKLIEKRELNVLRPKKLIWEEDYFFDCIHLNGTGSERLMDFIINNQN